MRPSVTRRSVNSGLLHGHLARHRWLSDRYRKRQATRRKSVIFPVACECSALVTDTDHPVDIFCLRLSFLAVRTRVLLVPAPGSRGDIDVFA